MKKIFLNFMVLVGAVVCLSGCLGDDTGTTSYVTVSNAYVVNSGNMYSQISGSISSLAFDLYSDSTITVTDNAFQSANGRKLGMVPNDLLIYGTKMYITVNGENTIEVVDKNTLKSIAQVRTTDLLGTVEGVGPRCLNAYNGNIYFTTYGGYVGVIDTTSYALQKKYESGSYPEDMVMTSSYLYVANSDYAKGKNPSIARFDLNTGTKTEITEGVVNPTIMTVCNNCIFTLENNTYNDDYSVKTKCDSVGVVVGNRLVHVAKATCMASLDNSSYAQRLYIAKQDTDSVRYVTYTPYGTTNPTAGKTATFITDGPQHPAGISVDEYTGFVYIAYYKENSQGYADYSSPAYINVYKYDGTVVKKELQVGLCPTFMEFNRKLVTY